MATPTVTDRSAANTLLDWSFSDAEAFGSRPHVARHRLAETGHFDDAALASLLDRIPRDRVDPYTMGTDPQRMADWRRGARTELPGAQLVDLVKRGRLWLNLIAVSRYDDILGELVERLYAEVSDRVEGFDLRRAAGTLIVSSPSAFVLYHADNQPNMLWHIRGRKRVWVYPRTSRCVSEENLARLVAGESDEDLPYDSGLDRYATVLDLDPGDVGFWPQNCPHRVCNLEGLNVSLSTEHRTPASTRRELVWTANHWLRSRARVPARSTREDGVGAVAKVQLVRAMRRSGLWRPDMSTRMQPSFTVDVDAPNGVRSM